ncbi:MAG: enolase C-terminal domain-like protein [Candidatus Bathyarchaeia archaeon]
MSTIIKDVKARKIIDTRVEYTIEVDVVTEGGGFGRAAAPLGAPASRSVWEPPSYPKGGVDEAVQKVNGAIASKLIGLDAKKQWLIDETLKDIDGTQNFASIGGNVAAAVSIATAKAAASTLKLPLYVYLGTPFVSQLPFPIANVIGGGPHARRGVTPDMQEHHVVPVRAKSASQAVHAVVLAYRKAKELCIKKDSKFAAAVDDESAWITNFTDREALDVLAQVCEEVKNETGVDIRLGIDAASSNLWDGNKRVYKYSREGLERNAGEQLDFICDLIETFPLYFIEDSFHESDYDSYKELTKKFGGKCLICGDDIFSSNSNRLRKGIECGACNSIIIKTNQAGTLTDVYKTIKLAHKHGYITVQSRRSGETETNPITDLAVAWGCRFIKVGVAGIASVRLSDLLRIEHELSAQANMAEASMRP